MATNLYSKLGDVEYDGLVTDIQPPVIVRSGTIRKLGTAGTLKRGTILAKSSGSAGDGKLVILGTSAVTNETLTPDCILTDDVAVGTSADVVATVYYGGCFDLAKCDVKSGYTITTADKDTLREKGILFKNASAAL